MKHIISLGMLVFFVSFSSCKDTKEKEKEDIETIEKIDLIEVESENILDEIKKEEKDLERELNELDNL